MSQSDVTFATSTTTISEYFRSVWTYSKSGSHIFLATRGGVGVENIKHGSMLCFILCAPGPAQVEKDGKRMGKGWKTGLLCIV
jgi:hypothetical protein